MNAVVVINVNHKELQERLKETGIQSLPIGTLRRWAAEGLIERPVRESRPPKRGRFAEWPEKALEDAVATWVVRYSDPVLGPPSKTHLLGIKKAAEELQAAPWKHCEIGLRQIPDDPPWYTFEPLWYSSYIADAGASDEYILVTPHELVSKWLAAVEKVRRRAPLRDSAIFVYDWIIDGPRNSKGELFDDHEFAYSFNRVSFETLQPFRGEERQWEPGQYWSGQDKVYIFFRIPEFKQDPLELIMKEKFLFRNK